MAAYLAPLAEVLGRAQGPGEVAVHQRPAKDQARAAAATVTEQLARPDVVAARRRAHRGLRHARPVRPTAPRPTPSCGPTSSGGARTTPPTLERAGTAVGTVVLGDRARGGLSHEIADRVEALTLDCVGLRVSLRGYQEFGVKYIVAQEPRRSSATRWAWARPSRRSAP